MPSSIIPTFPVKAAEFRNAVLRFHRIHPLGYFLTIKDEPFYETCPTLLLGGFGDCGVCVDRTGNIVNLFNRTLKGQGDHLLDRAIKSGATKVDCFAPAGGGGLQEFYESRGFEVVERYPFDPDQVDDPRQLEHLGPDWDYLFLELR